MGYDAKALQAKGFGISGARKSLTSSKTNEIADMLTQFKNGTGQIVMTPNGTIYDANSKLVKTAPPEIQNDYTELSSLEQSY